MYVDIVFPNNNEEEFISMAFKLGYNGLCFVYIDIKDTDKIKEKIDNLQKNTKINLFFGFKCEEIKKIKNNLTFIKSSYNIQKTLEKGKFDVLYGTEDVFKKDYIHHRASGLNHVLCKLAFKNKVMIAFSLNSILRSREKPKLLGRITQNIKLCRKYNIKMILASFALEPFEMRAYHDLISLGIVLGMTNLEAKRSLQNILEKIKNS